MSNPLLYSSVKLDLFSKDGVHLGQASGFLVEAANQYYLITNRHIVSGREISLHRQQEPAIEPHFLKTSIHIYGGDEENSFPLSWGVWKKITIQLYEDSAAPRWLERRTSEQHQHRPDVVALPIQLNHALKFKQAVMQFSEKIAGTISNRRYWSKISAIPIKAIETEVEYSPPDIVYIIGYPIGWVPAGTDKSSAAFWRTSSIASEIEEIGKTRANTFFIDPCALEGMSGSPVIGMKNNRMKLLGVCSDSSTVEFGANAGLVWDAFLVKELIGELD